MKQTEHYGLKQWEPSDCILREDFNADNAKIDTALADASRRAGAALFKELPGNTTPNQVIIPTGDVRWHEVSTVHILAYPVCADGTPLDVEMHFHGQTISLGTMPGNLSPRPEDEYHMLHIILFPMYNWNHKISMLVMGTSNAGLMEVDTTYIDISSVRLYARDSNQILAGSKSQIWTRQ